MSALYASPADNGNEEVVRIPRPADGVGAALRQVFGAGGFPPDWARLLQRLDRVR